MTNVLEAVYNIATQKDYTLSSKSSGSNRVNSLGVALENYIKDAFAGTFHIKDEEEKLRVFNQKFSWLGSQNHPPDIMIRGGDAIEVKKIQGAGSSLALNSSYPKSNITSSSPMITKECVSCEAWDVKDLVYCIGHVSHNCLKSLWIVDGSIYAAKNETYQEIKRKISSGISTIANAHFSETKELGRLNNVDPLGITSLRIRGMWQIQNPSKVFDYLNIDSRNEFQLICLIPVSKYNSMPTKSREKIENLNTPEFRSDIVEVKDPNNSTKLIDCIMLTII